MIDSYFLHIAGFSCTFALFSYLYKILRLHRKVKVNCWFCNENTKVEYRLSNCFTCPFCEQYNGFLEDGSYNCIIPAQHSEQYNFSIRRFQKHTSPKDNSKFENGFCETCNLNQALKIRAIAEFSSIPSNSIDEVEKFRERLEEIYVLCQQCQAILRQKLGKQNSWLKPQLISWKLMQSKAKSLKNQSLGVYKTASKRIIRKFLLCSCLMLCFLSAANYHPYDLEEFDLSVKLPFVKLDLAYSGLIIASLLLQSCLIFQQKVWKGKKLLSFSGWTIILLLDNFLQLSPSETQHIQFACNVVNLLFVAWVTKNVSCHDIKSKKSKHSAKKRVVSNDVSFFTLNDLDSSFSTCQESSAHCTSEKLSSASEEEELDNDLLSLKISTPKKVTSQGSENFSPQKLFRENSSSKKVHSILQPSKFGKHFITQASWVAGGYWGSPGSPQRGRLTSHNVSHLDENRPKPSFSLSRSSSQSSGFVSQYSDCPSKTHSNPFLNQIPRRPYSPRQNSLTGDPNERGSIYSRSRSPLAAPFSSPKSHNVDSFDVLSACSASSFYSDNSQLLRRGSTMSGSCFHDVGSPRAILNEVLPRDKDCTSRANPVSTYFNLGVAFVLGLSVSANIFLVILLLQYIFVK